MNFTSETDPERAGISYGDNLARLAKIKHRYDPDNVFNSTVNFRPQA